MLLLMGAVIFHLPDGTVKDRSTARASVCQPAKIEFVLADFDGDREPDLALVEMGNLRSARTNYSIRLHFTARAESLIGVDGPIGGLRVAARDVNGNDNLDLILTSNLDTHFVTILLNDGHGNFSAAAPGAYPEVENEVAAVLNGPAGPIMDKATLELARFPFSEDGAQGCEYPACVNLYGLASLRDQTLPQWETHSCLGRSPPAFFAIS